MKKVFYYFIPLIIFSACESNGLENLLPEVTVEMSESAGEAVDLGLSVNWADDDVSSYYYQWAGIDAFRGGESAYDWVVPFEDKYTSYSGSIYDIARLEWGGNWRTPTAAEWQELIDKCKFTEYYEGWLVTGPNGNSIYLTYRGPYGLGSSVYYWTSSRIRHGGWKGTPAAVLVSDFKIADPEPTAPSNLARVRPVCDKISK